MSVITIRLKRPKSEVVRASRGNLNQWINGLIDHALAPRETDWNTHFKKERRSIDYDAVLKARRDER